MLTKINTAYATLSDPRKRADYDAGRAEQGSWEPKQRQVEEQQRKKRDTQPSRKDLCRYLDSRA